MRLKNIIVLSLVTQILCANWAYCQDPINLAPSEIQALKETLAACDKALDASQKAASDKDAIIKVNNELLSTQAAEIQSLRSRPLTENPLIWFIGGMLVTGLTVRLVK